MNYKYVLPRYLIDKVSKFEEFAIGGMQVSIRTRDGKVFKNILISNCMYIVAMRGFKSLPFDISDISDIFQTDEDKNPKDRGGWDYWDTW